MGRSGSSVTSTGFWGREESVLCRKSRLEDFGVMGFENMEGDGGAGLVTSAGNSVCYERANSQHFVDGQSCLFHDSQIEYGFVGYVAEKGTSPGTVTCKIRVWGCQNGGREPRCRSAIRSRRQENKESEQRLCQRRVAVEACAALFEIWAVVCSEFGLGWAAGAKYLVPRRVYLIS